MGTPVPTVNFENLVSHTPENFEILDFQKSKFPQKHRRIISKIFQKSTKSVSETSPIHLDPHYEVVELAEICRLRYSKWGGR